jgi:nucleoside-diphosphate-sugar epimerase
MTKISVLGCGWLGLPLAEQLIKNGFAIKGSTTSIEKIPVLESIGIQPFLIALSEKEVLGAMATFLENSKILVIAIPPQLRGLATENFVAKINNLIAYIEQSSVSQILFVSSTSVYKDDNMVVTEDTLAEPVTESGKQLLACEQLLLKNKNFETTIIRFGGLIGPNRNPARFLAGRKNIENPDAPINLIHQEDCIGMIMKIITNNVWNEIFNGVAPFHPTRALYYTKKAAELHLELPHFNSDIVSNGKTISSEKAIRILEYEFQFKAL